MKEVLRSGGSQSQTRHQSSRLAAIPALAHLCGLGGPLSCPEGESLPGGERWEPGQCRPKSRLQPHWSPALGEGLTGMDES